MRDYYVSEYWVSSVTVSTSSATGRDTRETKTDADEEEVLFHYVKKPPKQQELFEREAEAVFAEMQRTKVPAAAPVGRVWYKGKQLTAQLPMPFLNRTSSSSTEREGEHYIGGMAGTWEQARGRYISQRLLQKEKGFRAHHRDAGRDRAAGSGEHGGSEFIPQNKHENTSNTKKLRLRLRFKPRPSVRRMFSPWDGFLDLAAMSVLCAPGPVDDVVIDDIGYDEIDGYRDWFSPVRDVDQKTSRQHHHDDVVSEEDPDNPAKDSSSAPQGRVLKTKNPRRPGLASFLKSLPTLTRGTRRLPRCQFWEVVDQSSFLKARHLGVELLGVVGDLLFSAERDRRSIMYLYFGRRVDEIVDPATGARWSGREANRYAVVGVSSLSKTSRCIGGRRGTSERDRRGIGVTSE